jgi:hypothetical protein
VRGSNAGRDILAQPPDDPSRDPVGRRLAPRIAGRLKARSFHCFSRYVKVTFFRGAWLRPVPPGESKPAQVRYLDIREDDRIDEALLASWIGQAARLPGWDPSAKKEAI